MAQQSPVLEMGRESGVEAIRFRAHGRAVTVCGATIDGENGVFDNGVLESKSKLEQGIDFGPEVLRAMNGKRVLAIWLAAANNADGKPGWIGLSVGEMRIEAAKKQGWRDVTAFSVKLMEAAKGRVAISQMKALELKALLGLLAQKPDLWVNAEKAFRTTVLAIAPIAAEIGATAESRAAAAAAPDAGAPPVAVEGGAPSASLRCFGRDVTVVGVLLQDGTAAWDNGVLAGKSKAEQGITFGAEPMRAMQGKRVCAIFVAATRQDDGKPGWFGATVAEMRIDAVKKDGFKDLAAGSMKLNDAARGRVEVWRLKPEERKALGDLVRAQGDLWESAFDNFRAALS